MKNILVFCWLLPLLLCEANIINASYDYPDPDQSSEETTEKPIHKCTKMKFYCESCSDLVMCIETEYGFTKQYVTCSDNSTCLRDKCTTDTNPLCDGTSDIPFKCHIAGIFPDPFDCKKYHFCVPRSNKVVNGTLRLNHFEHSCQEDDGVEYKYDPKTRYCKYKIEKGCETWPVPLCKYEGQTDALKENRSMFYVCDFVEGRLYPHLYACPHGEEYNMFSTKCQHPIDNPPPLPDLPPFYNYRG